MSDQNGNIVPNTLNSGFVCYADGMTIITNTKGGIYLFDQDEKKLISEDIAEHVNFYQDHIYYLSNHTIYRIKPDGTGKELVLEDCNQFAIENGILYFEQADQLQSVSLNLPNVVKPVIRKYEHISSFCIYKSKIYYMADTTTIICADLRGQKELAAIGSHIIDFCINSDTLYYADSNQKDVVVLCSIGIESKEKNLLMSIPSHWAHFIVVDKQIYYINCSNFRLYNSSPMVDEDIFPPLNYSDGYLYYFSHEELWALKRIDVQKLEVEFIEEDIENLRLSNLADHCIYRQEYPLIYKNEVYTAYDKSIYCMNEDGSNKRKIYTFETPSDVEINKIIDIRDNSITFCCGNEYDYQGGIVCADLTKQYDNMVYPSDVLDAVRYKDVFYFFENNEHLELRSVDFKGRIEDLVGIEEGAELDWTLRHEDGSIENLVDLKENAKFGWMIRSEEMIYYCINFDDEKHSIFGFNIADNSNEELTSRKSGISSHSFIYNNGIYYDVLRVKGNYTKLIRFDLQTYKRMTINWAKNHTKFLIAQDDTYYCSLLIENGLCPTYKVTDDEASEYPVNRAGHSYAPEVGKALIKQAKKN